MSLWAVLIPLGFRLPKPLHILTSHQNLAGDPLPIVTLCVNSLAHLVWDMPRRAKSVAATLHCGIGDTTKLAIGIKRNKATKPSI